MNYVTVVPISNEDIDALSYACRTLSMLYDLHGKEEHKEASDRLGEVLKRSSGRYGTASDTRPGQVLLHALLDVLPPEEQK